VAGSFVPATLEWPGSSKENLLSTLFDIISSADEVSCSGNYVGRDGLILPPISDARLKRDIKPVETLVSGVKLYSFRYLEDEQEFVGVLAQDLLENELFASAVVHRPDGFLAVSYDALGLEVSNEAEMIAAGERATKHALERRTAQASRSFESMTG
jgi:hypothetical protein